VWLEEIHHSSFSLLHSPSEGGRNPPGSLAGFAATFIILHSSFCIPPGVALGGFSRLEENAVSTIAAMIQPT
jgi:hypothetical protein